MCTGFLDTALRLYLKIPFMPNPTTSHSRVSLSGMNTPSDTPATTSEALSFGKTKKIPVSWSSKEESFLVDCLFDARNEGKQQDSGFKPDIWVPISARFDNELGPPDFGPKKDVPSIKNKVNSLKTEWKIVKKMVSQLGWGWDKETGMVKIPPGVWEAYVEVNKQAKPFHKWPFPLYKCLTDLFGDSTADGRDTF
jgi:hypothetical protein